MQNEPFLNKQPFQLWTLVHFFMITFPNLIFKILYRMLNNIYFDLQTFTPDVKIVKLRPVIKLYFPGILEGDRYGRDSSDGIGIQPDSNSK